jgi:hypothetical protein
MDPTSNEQAAEQLGTPSQIAGQELNNNSDPEDPPRRLPVTT